LKNKFLFYAYKIQIYYYYEMKERWQEGKKKKSTVILANVENKLHILLESITHLMMEYSLNNVYDL
jgi:hypothetical protein